MRVGINMPREEIAAFCARWQVSELALFGSVLRDDFDADSDVDVLVEFVPGCSPGLIGITRMESELSDLFLRDVDLVTRAAIEASRNYIRRNAILESAEVVYAA